RPAGVATAGGEYPAARAGTQWLARGQGGKSEPAGRTLTLRLVRRRFPRLFLSLLLRRPPFDNHRLLAKRHGADTFLGEQRQDEADEFGSQGFQAAGSLLIVRVLADGLQQ